jgi:gas vesicle protein GvpL/GvpF
MAQTPADRRLRPALGKLAAEDVSELIAEARQEARVRVRAHLADALTEAMLDRAYRAITEFAETDHEPKRKPRPAAETQPPAQPEPAQPAPQEGTGVYIYCVVPADTELPRDLPSIDPAHSPTLIRHERLAAVVSPVPLADFGEERLRERLADMDWLERTARAHELALETVGRHATLIPMRLCSVYRNETGVKEMLAREAKALEEALVHLDGKTEWGLKVFAPSTTATSTDGEPGASGTEYMQRRRSDRDRRRNADQELHDDCVAIHERLAAVVADALTSPPQRPEVSGHAGQMLLNGVYLVEDDQLNTFLTLVDQLKARYLTDGLELQVTGPWPAYNFVPGTIGAAW